MTGKALAGTAAKIPNTVQRNLAPQSDLGVVAAAPSVRILNLIDRDRFLRAEMKEPTNSRSPDLAIRASRAFAPEGANLTNAPSTPKMYHSIGAGTKKRASAGRPGLRT